MAGRKRASDRRLRAPFRSPGRPGAAKREGRRQFWLAIAAGRSSDDAAVDVGISPAGGITVVPGGRRHGANRSGASRAIAIGAVSLLGRAHGAQTEDGEAGRERRPAPIRRGSPCRLRRASRRQADRGAGHNLEKATSWSTADATVGTGLEPGTDLGEAEDRLSQGRDDAHQPRGHLPVPLRPRPRGIEARPGRLPADRARSARPARTRPRTLQVHRLSRRHDFRATWRGGGPGRAWPLGGRPNPGPAALGHRYFGGTGHALHDPAPSAARRKEARRARTDRHGSSRGGDGPWRGGGATPSLPPSPRCPRTSAARRPGTRAPKWPGMPNCASITVCRSTSATRTAPGSAARTRPPTDCCGSTSRRPRTSPPTDRTTSTLSPPHLMPGVRKMLGWKTPAEALDELLTKAQTASVATTG